MHAKNGDIRNNRGDSAQMQLISDASLPGAALRHLDLTYHATVRHLRRNHGNAMVGLLVNIAQTVVFLVALYAMFTLLGARRATVRGDFMLYIMSGVFLFMTHTKTVAAVVGSEGPAAPMMKHAPMNTVVAISAAALSTLYVQVLSVTLLLGGYHLGWQRVVIEQPLGAFGMILLAWFSGLSVGMVLLAVKPWAPEVVSVASSAWSRANMIASGKMFVANQMPGTMLALFTWNPLFHIIDQARGFLFINYNPHHSNLLYPVTVSAGLLMLGLLGEFRTRQSASLSWEARR